MTRRRLLLVEDDASIRRFVTLALEDDALDVVAAPTLADAVQALRGPPFDVVMCDLMLPDGSGLDLLRELSAPGAPSPNACRVAFSAGVSAPVRQQLEQIGVHRVLGKPVSLADLSACVANALAVSANQSQSTPARATPNPGAASSHQRAIDDYFGGDAALHAAFSRQCAQQFALDAAAGDLALAHGDLAALRRLAHSLKSVLLTLGHDSDSTHAARLEACAAQGQTQISESLWPDLARRLRELSA